tara:strand:- start:711 stop:1241 length:531 start_codon:yes stop_codon:yes gene_type:complete
MGRSQVVPAVPDTALPAADYEPQATVFKPQPRHHKAVDAFMETHSIQEMHKVLGGSTLAPTFALSRHPWFLKQLKDRGFVAIDTKDLGRSLAVGAGVRALEHLEEPDLSVDAIKKLGELGIKLMDAGSGGAAGPAHVGNILALDLRGLSVQEMREMLGGSAATAASDVIDTDWSAT